MGDGELRARVPKIVPKIGTRDDNSRHRITDRETGESRSVGCEAERSQQCDRNCRA